MNMKILADISFVVLMAFCFATRADTAIGLAAPLAGTFAVYGDQVKNDA